MSPAACYENQKETFHMPCLSIRKLSKALLIYQKAIKGPAYLKEPIKGPAYLKEPITCPAYLKEPITCPAYLKEPLRKLYIFKDRVLPASYLP